MNLAPADKENTLGIDFGTTNTTVSFFDRDRVSCIHFTQYGTLVKSVVVYDENDNVIIGNAAHEIRNPFFRARNVKYIVGRNIKECEEIRDDLFEAKLDYDANGNALLVSNTRNGVVSKSPLQVVTSLLRLLKEKAESQTEKSFPYVVLTVPTTFKTNQKRALKEAATNAGFKVRAMISEPTAAGLHYQMNNDMADKGVYLVFDFGGGTLDLSLMYCKDGMYDTLASAGNHDLGGNDVDKVALEEVERLYRNSNGTALFADNSVRTNRRRVRILSSIETMKIELQAPNKKAYSLQIEDGDDDTCTVQV